MFLLYTFLYYFRIKLYNEICCEHVNMCMQWMGSIYYDNNANIREYLIRLPTSIIPYIYIYHVYTMAFLINYIISYVIIMYILKEKYSFYHIKKSMETLCICIETKFKCKSVKEREREGGGIIIKLFLFMG